MPNVKENKSYVTAEYLKKRASEEDVVNQESYRMLQIQEGDKILELGCGPGTAVSAFAKAVGSTGLVVGVDYDPKMIQQARASSKHYTNVLQSVGDAHRLPFGDGKFDRVYAKRLFQVLPPDSAPKVLGEMERVLKPGGILVLVDTDWNSVAVNFSGLELERRLTGFFRDHMRPNGLAGRQLLGMTQQGSLANVDVRVMTMIIRDFAETPFSDWLITEASKAKIATSDELANWSRELEEKTSRQAFLFHVATVLVSAKKK